VPHRNASLDLAPPRTPDTDPGFDDVFLNRRQSKSSNHGWVDDPLIDVFL
jgi:hypothetical protein